MRERPILFTGPMVRAILDGSKTQTRRVMKWPEWIEDREAGAYWLNRHPCAALHKDGRPVRQFCCPYGVPGDLLYVRETWGMASLGTRVAYKADFDGPTDMRWKPSIHMPKRFARLWLRVTDVRVERVQEISEEDAIAEGAPPKPNHLCVSMSPFRAGFMDLWDSINAKRGYGWDTNPWVWVISFERIDR